METATIARDVTEAVLRNLRGRKGVGDELFMIQDLYPDIYDELVTEVSDTVEEVLNGDRS